MSTGSAKEPQSVSKEEQQLAERLLRPSLSINLLSRSPKSAGRAGGRRGAAAPSDLAAVRGASGGDGKSARKGIRKRKKALSTLCTL